MKNYVSSENFKSKLSKKIRLFKFSIFERVGTYFPGI